MDKLKHWVQTQKTARNIAAWSVAGLVFYLIKDINFAELVGLSQPKKIKFQSADFGATTNESTAPTEDKKP